MPNIKSAMKRLRQNEKRRLRNAAVKSKVKTCVKKARTAIESEGEGEAAKKAVYEASVAIDKAVSKGIIHRCNGARKKSRLQLALNKRSASVSD